MKKGLKIAGAIAALAALVPYSINKNEETGEVTTHALLWKLTTRPAPGEDGGRSVTIDLGFHDPFAEKKEDGLPDDDETDLYEDDACWCCSAAVPEAADPEAKDPEDSSSF